MARRPAHRSAPLERKRRGPSQSRIALRAGRVRAPAEDGSPSEERVVTEAMLREQRDAIRRWLWEGGGGATIRG
jgi:hypothetical protein